jgi:hypothetical protein
MHNSRARQSVAGGQGRIARIRRIGRIARQARGYQNGGAEHLEE